MPALAPDERRAALVEATIPLLHRHGLDVSTRQIAQAAGVAEGTIFGVFESKSSLLVCSVIKALDPQPTLDALAGIDRSLPLRERVSQSATLLNNRFAETAALMGAARKLIYMEPGDPAARDRMAANREQLHTALAEVLEPDAARLRRSPRSVALLLLLFCSAHNFGPFGGPEGFSGDEAASLLLDGLLVRDDKRGTQQC